MEILGLIVGLILLPYQVAVHVGNLTEAYKSFCEVQLQGTWTPQYPTVNSMGGDSCPDGKWSYVIQARKNKP